ncbi:MAG: PAS domain S-box protein, partial [Myxococcales bacterium]|nr:PAS domain S-box protein [Myxococcales bacterium]
MNLQANEVFERLELFESIARETREGAAPSEERRRFIEAVLGGVTSAVVGLDPNGQVTLVNRAAQDLLGASSEELRGRPLGEVVGEAEVLIRAARLRPGRPADRQITVARADGQLRTVFARIVAQSDGGTLGGLVCTFDDITELLSAQRKAAWAD